MLQSFRKIVDTWYGKLLGGLLLIGLAGFGVTGLLTNATNNTIARVGDQDISSQDFQRAYNGQLNVIAQQTGSVPTPELAVAYGIPSGVLNQLTSEAALNRLAGEMGLGVTQERLAESLRQDPSFSGLLGNFDPDIFQESLRRNGLTEAQFFAGRRKAAGREQLGLALFNEAPVSAVIADIANRFGNDLRVVDYVNLTDSDLLPLDEPTDEELAVFLELNQASYRTPEVRSIDLLILSPELMIDRYEVSDAELMEEYERSQASLTVPEKRIIQQVQLPADATVRWFEHGLTNTKPFAQLLEESQLTATDLGLVAEAEIADAGLAEAAFALDAGEFAIIDGVQGKRAVFVAEIVEGGVPALTEIQDELANRLKLTKARNDYIDLLDQVEEARAGFVSLADIGEQFDLAIHSLELTEGGSELADIPGIAEEQDGRIATAVFAADMDRLAAAIILSSDENAWFDLKAIEEPRDQTMDEVRETVAADWMADARALALSDKAVALVETFENGDDFAGIAVGESLSPQFSSQFKRQGEAGGVIGPQVAAMAFAGPLGHVDFAPDGSGGYVIFKVREIIPATGDLAEQESDLIDTSFRDSVFSAFAQDMRDDAGMSINEELLVQVIGLDTTSNGL